jgi:hypothetical protein
MKTSLKLLSSLTALFFSVTVSAQDCELYFPAKEGTVTEMKSYDAKGKLTGTSKTTILRNTAISGGVEITAGIEYFSEKNEPVFTTEYMVRCEKGDFTVDMKNLMGASMGAYKDMQIDVTGDKLKLPKNPAAGDMLNGGTMVVKISSPGSPVGMTMTTNISNRKVDALEKLTTPAGTFDCVKISYDMDTKMMFSIKSHVVEYYAKNVGMVKSESFDKKGKSMGYTLLTGQSQK